RPRGRSIFGEPSSQGMRKWVGSQRCRWASTMAVGGTGAGYHRSAVLIDERAVMRKGLEERARALAETYAWTDGALAVLGKMPLRPSEKAELLGHLGALRGHARAARDAAYGLMAALDKQT